MRTAYQPDITYNGKTETTPEGWYFWEKGSSLPLVAADLSNIEEFVANHQYLESIDCPDITAAQITIATKNLKSGKPPSSDDVNDEVVKRTHHIINPPSALAFQLEFATRISPYILQTIDHDTAKEARRRQNRHSGGHCTPNTLGKVFESIMATRISYLTETEDILPPNHIGGRKGLSYEVALHMTSAIHKAWEVGSATLLSLTCHTRDSSTTLSNGDLEADRAPWVTNFLQDRTTIMKVMRGRCCLRFWGVLLSASWMRRLIGEMGEWNESSYEALGA